MVERAAAVEAYAVEPGRTLDRRGRDERRARDHATAVEHLHLAETLAAPHRQLDLHRRDDALDERTLDVDDAEGRLGGDEPDVRLLVGRSRPPVGAVAVDRPDRAVAREAPGEELGEVRVP